MRSTKDRIHHAILFEVIALFLVVPLIAWIYAMPLDHIGVVAIVSATLAMLWNYVFNLGFDHLMRHLTGSTGKSFRVRVAHALLFEGGLLLILAPFIAWYLDISFLHALLMDATLAAFYVLYAFSFNWLYDVVFPVPRTPAPEHAS